MRPPSFGACSTGSLLMPLMLVAGREISNPQPDAWPGVPLNWLYLAGPQLIVVLIGACFVPTRRFAWLPLLLLTLLVFGFQAWVIGWVPPRESGLAWLLYFPLALAVAGLSVSAQLIVKRMHRSVHISDDA